MRSLPTFFLLTAFAASCERAETAPDAGAVTADVPVAQVPFEPPPAVMRRLTRSQYLNTVRDVLGNDLVLPASVEPDTARDGFFAIGASESSVSRRGVEQFQAAAFDLASQVLREPARRARVVTCTPSGTQDEACARAALSALARRLWRRPVSEAELAPFVRVSTEAAVALEDFYRGLEYGVAGLLQSVDLLYRPELGVAAAPAARTRFTPVEMASRLAFFLWDGPPDDELLRAAEDGSLDRDDGLRAQVDRMLRSERSRRGLRAFVTEWLTLYALDGITRDAAVFPAYNAEVASAAREETLRLVEHVAFTDDQDFRDLLTTRTTFVNRRLAAIYNVRFPARASEATANDFARVELPASEGRRGLLGNASLLLLNAHPTSTSPTLRGKFIRQSLLCSPIPDPPVNVNTAIPEASPRLPTLRERIAEHSTNDTCRSCHQLMDPIGLSLENFDGIGRYRTEDNGSPIDPRGNLGTQTFRDASGLAQTLHDDPDFPRCVVTKLYRFANGRSERPGEYGELSRLQRGFASNGYRFQWLLGEIATSAAFRAIAAPEVTP